MTARVPDVSVITHALDRDLPFVEWPDATDGFAPIDHWERERSGTAFYRMRVLPLGDEIVVKHGVGWSPDVARQQHQAMTDLDRVIDAARIDGAHAVRSLGWVAEPPLLLMRHVPGLDVVSILRDRSHRAWSDGASLLVDWMTRAGEMLAEFHNASRQLSASEIDETAASVGRLARSVIVRSGRSSLLQAKARQRAFVLYGDFGPGNLMGAPDGELFLLDPPDRVLIGPAHRDLAHFLFELRRQLAGRGYTRHPRVPGRFPELRGAFAEGYSRRSAAGPLDDVDDALVALFELRRAVGMARKRWPARGGDAAWFMVSAARRRFDVTCPDR